MLKQSTLSESDAQLHAFLLGLFNVRPKLSLFRIFSVILNDKLTNKSESSDEELNRVCLEIKTKLNPEGDIEIKYVGLRPGEKLYEELLVGDNCTKTNNPLIMRAEEDMILWDDLKPKLDSLKKEVISCDQEKIRKLLIEIVPGFTPQSDIVDILYKKTS